MKKRHSRYLEILKKMKEPIGSLEKGETQIETDPKKLLQIEETLRAKFQQKGEDPDCGNVGVFFENPWYVFMNEPVYFPGKEPGEKFPGSYLRVLYKGDSEGEKSAFCLPVLKNGDFLLTVSYRTTVRNWVIEAPGTVAQKGEKTEDALKRCIKEKLGREIIEIKTLSEDGIISERGIMGAAVPVFLVKVEEKQTQEIKDLNVRGVAQIKPEDLKKGFLKGKMEIDGKTCLCQDGYTAFALFLLGLKKS